MILKIIKILLIILLLSVQLYAEAFFAGGVSSVNSDSGFNALRNPALMSGQDKDSAGFIYMHLYNVYTDTSGTIEDSSLSDTEIEVTSDEKYNANFSLSYVNRFSGGAFGFAVRKPEGEDQVRISESNFAMSGIYTPLPMPIEIKNETNEETKSFAISSVISYSKDLGRNESVGIQFETGISESTSEKEKKSSGFGNEDYNMEVSTKKLIGNLNCGYYYVADKYQVGAIIKIGEYAYEKQDYSYENNLTSAEKSDEVSPFLYKNKGIEYTLGFGYNLTNTLLFNLEMNIGLPFDKETQSLKDDDNGLMAEEESTEYANYSSLVSGGFDYKYSPNLKLGIGCGVGIYSADVSGSDGIKIGEYGYNRYSFITGLEVRPAENIRILFGLSLIYFELSQKSNVGSQKLDIESEAFYMNALVGASMYY
jgi:hypothetical protein